MKFNDIIGGRALRATFGTTMLVFLLLACNAHAAHTEIRLTTDLANENYGVWSPDGTKIAFVSDGVITTIVSER